MRDRELPLEVRHLVEDTYGRRIVRFEPVTAGLTQALAGIASLDDGARAFIKAGLNEHARPQVAAEIRNLRSLRASFLPRVLGASVDPPTLILEDLSAGQWPEPYPDELGGLEAALEELRSLPIPPDLELRRVRPPGKRILSRLEADARIAVPPAAGWVEQHAALIRDAVGSLGGGNALVHSDLWYSNICFLPDRVVLVDWSDLSIGSPWFDAASVSIDLVIEGRRPLISEEAAGWAAAHTAWMIWSLARGPGPAIADPEAWIKDDRELFDGAAWWLAHELGIGPPPRLTTRSVGW
jgi:hypothetical protein